MRRQSCDTIREAIHAIDFKGEYVKHERYGNGHINDTFLVYFQQKQRWVKYILQRMNQEVFKNPEQLMKNIYGVTEFLKEKIKENHGDTQRETMNIIRTKEGKYFYTDTAGNCWRAYVYIKDAICYEQVDQPETFYESGVAFGHFQSLLSDYDANSLFETIPDFHNTPVRFQQFLEAVQEDRSGRVKDVKWEIAFLKEREAQMNICMDLLNHGHLPLRVTHNDTKLNNVMMDQASGKAICVIDLDTVMPGLSINDFGDSIRFGANTAAEDETDLSKVSLNLELYQMYVKGFLKGCANRLTKTEIEMLPMGAKMMTLECGMRFLTDHLNGDTYFHIHRENHNLDRCRTQFKLVEDMEQKWEDMKRIIIENS